MRYLFFLLLLPVILFSAPVKLGIDRVFEEGYSSLIKKKRIALITNHTGVNSKLQSNVDLFKEKGNLVAIFSPEHGMVGAQYAAESTEGVKEYQGIKLYSLHGKSKRPTEEMLKGIDVLIYDIQEIGCRSYTYISTLFYAMEEAARHNIQVIVLDRPNPMGGIVVDGPMMRENWRSFLGYINIPYCHGMTVGELARFFNQEYKIKCSLQVIPMSGWHRKMTYKDTGLAWIPTSPYIPEPDTPFYYASTGILGALNVVSIGIGYTLPFKVVGAPWIEGAVLSDKLNAQKLPGVTFLPFCYRPFYGKFKGKECEGVKIVITDAQIYRPLAVQYMLIGMLKSLYPVHFRTKLDQITPAEVSSFCKINGSAEILKIIQNEKYIAWKLIEYDRAEREIFVEKRKPYLLYE